MRINREKLELAKARACMSSDDIIKAGIPRGTLGAICRGEVVWERELDLNETTKNTLEGMAFADITFLKDFKFSVKASLYNADAESRGYYNKEVGSGVNTSGLATRSITRDKSYTFQQQLTWNKIFKDVHNVEDQTAYLYRHHKVQK